MVMKLILFVKNQIKKSMLLEHHISWKILLVYVKNILSIWNAITINLDVNNLDIKSPEFIQLETENQEKSEKIENYENLIVNIDERLQSLEKRSGG